jgi:hypothetical protein
VHRVGELDLADERARRTAARPPAPLPPAAALALTLQRGAGNHATALMLRQRAVLQRQPTQTQERNAMPRTDLGIHVVDGTTAELQGERDRLKRILETESPTEAEMTEIGRSLARLEVLLGERGNSTLADAGMELEFDGSQLRVTGTGATAFRAVSGRPGPDGSFDYGPARQREESVGPIPAGTYWIDPRQMKDMALNNLFSEGSARGWGSHRITIHPFDDTHTFGRGGFFIHGGTIPGSAGCIDLTTEMARFAALVSAVPAGQKVKLRVVYPVLGDFPAPPPDQRAG